jgi:ABC-type dipeptide/oligopeptide/nickel transport system permease component
VRRERYGRDESFPEKCLHWLQSIWRRDLGYPVIYNGPVAPLLWPRVRNTLLLTVTATALAWPVALGVGAWAASRKGKWPDRLTAAGTTIVARHLPIIALASPHGLVGVIRGPGNLRPTVFDHHARWNVDELFWRGGPSGARR